jgi:hypothetical protein
MQLIKKFQLHFESDYIIEVVNTKGLSRKFLKIGSLPTIEAPSKNKKRSKPSTING